MGADGHVVLIPVSEFKERFPDIAAERFGLHSRTVLGTDAYVYYWDTENHGPPWEWGVPYGEQPWSDREKEVLLELQAIGEDIEVWT